MNNNDKIKEITRISEEIEALKEKLAKLEETTPSSDDRSMGRYYTIDNCGDIFDDCDDYAEGDNFRYGTGNYFKTKEEAEARLKIINTEIKLRALIKKINKETNCSNNFPDWEDEHQGKYYLYMDHLDMDTCSTYTFMHLYSWEYCYRNFLDDAINEIGEEELVEYFKKR